MPNSAPENNAHQPTRMPMFLRLPKPKERCEYTGMSRTTMCELTVPSEINNFAPPVKSHVQTTRTGAKRGIRFVDSESLLAYIRSLPARAEIDASTHKAGPSN